MMTEFYLVKLNPIPSISLPHEIGEQPHVLCRDPILYTDGVWDFITDVAFNPGYFCPPWRFNSEEEVRKELVKQQTQTNDTIVVMNREEVDAIVFKNDNDLFDKIQKEEKENEQS